jgi:RhtB (resistance to homoserine/threonine) family protein
MDIFWINWFLLIGIFAMALAAPGPDFVMAVRNSVLHSRTAGIFTAIGFALGVGIHVTYTLFGIATLISQSVLLFSILKYAGAAYLFYIGIKSLRSNGYDRTSVQDVPKIGLSPLKALWSGFLTNALNPKATLFFLSIFSQFIGPQTPLAAQLLYAGTCVVMTALWFSFVAIVLTNQKVKAVFLKFTKWIDRVCGGLLIALGIKLALSKV